MPALLLLRHEEAAVADHEGDGARSLTPLGRTRMHAQAKALLEALPALDGVITSPLVRAVQTAEILVSAFDLDTPVRASRIVSEPPDLARLAEFIQEPPAPNGLIAMVGHEPTISALAGYLLGRVEPSFRVGQALLLEPSGANFVARGRWRGGQIIDS